MDRLTRAKTPQTKRTISSGWAEAKPTLPVPTTELYRRQSPEVARGPSDITVTSNLCSSTNLPTYLRHNQQSPSSTGPWHKSRAPEPPEEIESPSRHGEGRDRLSGSLERPLFRQQSVSQSFSRCSMAQMCRNGDFGLAQSRARYS